MARQTLWITLPSALHVQVDAARSLQHYTRRERNVEQEAQGIKVASNITCILLPSHCQQWGPTSWYPPHQQNSTHSSSLQGGGTYVQGFKWQERVPEFYQSDMLAWGAFTVSRTSLSNFLISSLTICKGKSSGSTTNMCHERHTSWGFLEFQEFWHIPGSFPWKPARGGFLCHALAVALPNQIQRMWKNVFCN